MKNKLFILPILIIVVALLTACSASKFVPDGEYMLHKVEIRSQEPGLDPAMLEPYIRQKGNSKWFSLFKVPLGVYALSGRDTTKWLNRTLQNIGEAPVLFDTLQARLTSEDLRLALQNMGYMNAQVDVDTYSHRHKLDVVYTLKPGIPYIIKNIKYDIADDSIAYLLENKLLNQGGGGLRVGSKFTVNELDQERKRITQYLNNQGYYHFNKDFIRYTADTIRGDKGISLTLHLQNYRASSGAEETSHPRYYIRKVNYLSDDSTRLPLRMRVLKDNTWVEENKPFSVDELQKTYNSLGRLSALKYTNIRLAEVPDTTLLDCNIQLSPNKANSISIQPEGTNTAGDLGAAISVTYSNRNVFHGSETFSVELRGAYEAITGLEGYQNQNYIEYNLESSLQFPRLLAPFLPARIRKHYSLATSELRVGWNMQNRPEFHRRLFSTAWRYRWGSVTHKNTTWRLDLLDLNYVYMPWISETFKRDYLDNASSRNAILRYNYEDLFIMKVGGGLTYNDGSNVLRASVETAGNLLHGISSLSHASKNANGQYALFNIAYAQYVKGDFDYTHLFVLDTHNQFALHARLGLAWPYGNSNVLPFEKRYFSGGANSVRGWNVRGLGPGSYKGTDGRIDFINQTGDIKLDLNAELRSWLFWKIYGAIFVDAGNIWTFREYEEQPGGQFRWNEFYKQIAVAYGIGFRLNLDYFIVRFDMGMKAINPAYETQNEHWAIIHPRLSRDFSFHFAVGLPF